jgi:LL-diaminopimelate aminotransferase
MIQAAQRLNGIGEYYFSQKLREIEYLNKTGVPIINLGIGSPDLPPHPAVIQTLQTESSKDNTHAYQSYKGVPALRNAMADWYQRWYGVALEADHEILPLIGSKEGIMHISMAFLNEGDEVLIPDPGYPTYKSATQLAGGIPIPYVLKEKNNWFPDFEELESLVSPRTKIMWVNYPQMPTGQLPTPALFEHLVAFARRHQILLCHDNPYSFILNSQPASILSVSGAKEVALELNSFSKSHNMAGWRVGMVCGNAALIQEVLRFKSNMDSGMFLPVQMAAVQALQLGPDWYESLNAVYQKRKEKAHRLLQLLGCSFNPQQAGLFVWAKIPEQYETGYKLSDEVLQKTRVFITPGGIFGAGGNRYLRISLCSSEEKLEEAIGRIQKTFGV